MTGQLRVSVIGSETRHPEKPPLTYTVYRTSVNYQGICYHRLIRFRHFWSFAKHLKLAPNAAPISVKLPPKIWWSRQVSLQSETVEARQVLLNEFMQQVSTRPLTPRSKERLLKLLQVGEFAPKEEEDRVINSRLSLKQQSVTLTEPMSEILDANHLSLQSDVSHQLPVNNEKQPQDSLTDEKEECCTADQVQDVTNSLLMRRQGSGASSNPTSDDTETQLDRSMLAPLTPPLQVQIRPVSISPTSQNVKRVISDSSKDADQLSLKEGDRDSTDPECRYSGQIKQCIASIEDIVDSSRKLEVHIREKHTV
ncbi:hypothetical protein DD238_005543 [Peronospora effusa]|uniref:PX domain-containing protein n=1 Tax=Peronospora effusa TaxID=542832 RepID=A0A3M6VEX6_9STRA|nr:hypothetical protein DD238_005543 [Peronospora effusa]RQM15237.1 hypothetical protein DD237_005465 [Peronospora effusa]